MNTLLSIMFLSFVGYISFIWIKYGIQASVSESYYRLPRKLQWLFTIATWGYALPAMVIGLDFTGSGLVFLSGAGIAFVGASPLFKETGLSATVHMVGAIIGITASQVFIWAVLWLWWIVIAFAAFSALAFIWKRLYSHFVWWVEIGAFASIFISYLIKL
jgi:hypothetical protein